MMPAWVGTALGIALVISAAVCAYWYRRALDAEHDARENLKSMKMWQELTDHWFQRWQSVEILLQATGEGQDDPDPEFVGENQARQPLNRAERFDYLNALFLHGLLNWRVRHD